VEGCLEPEDAVDGVDLGRTGFMLDLRGTRQHLPLGFGEIGSLAESAIRTAHGWPMPLAGFTTAMAA
jgi:hypothetical protein